MEMNELLSYVAGIIDGEGTISMRHPKSCSTFQVYVSVSNTDARLMERLSQLFEGQVYLFQRANPKHKPIFRWTLTGDAAYSFVELVRPFLLLKREQADKILAYQELKRSFGIHSGVVAPEEFLEEARVLREAVLLLNERGKEEVPM